MDIKNIERKEGKVSFQVVIDAATFEGAVNKTYLKEKKNIAIPGFRKGKAPRALIENMYGAAVFYEGAVESLALDAYNAGLEQTKDRTVGDPAITNYNVADDKTLTIDFESALYPEVTLGEYKGITAYKEPVKIMAADVNKELDAIRDRNARIVTVEREAKNGDTANIDFDGYLDGKRFDGGKAEGYNLVLGSGSFVPGFEEQVVGLKAGDEKDINVTFPTEYTPELAGKDVVFKVKVNEIKEKQLPALDDEFAKDVSEFDTLKEYKASLKKELEGKKKDAVDGAFRTLVMSKAVKNMTVDVPSVMVDARVDAIINDYARNCAMQGYTIDQYFQMMGINEQTFRMYIRSNAENEVRTDLLLEKIVEVENIEVSAEEIENEYKTSAETYQMEIEKIKEAVSEDLIAHDVKLKKASELIFKAAVATDVPEEEAEKPAEEAEEKKPAAKKTTKKTAKKTDAAEEKAEEKTEE